MKACLCQSKASAVSPPGRPTRPLGQPPKAFRVQDGRSPSGGHPRLTRTGRALKVEDGLQVVGLVELQVEGVLSLWGQEQE